MFRGEARTSHDWNWLGYASGDIYDFKSFLDEYNSVIIVVLIYAHLDKDSLSIDQVKAHDRVIETTIDKLDTRLAHTKDKFKALYAEGARELPPKPSKLRQVEIEKSITLACVRVCQHVSERIKQILSALEEGSLPPTPESAELHMSSREYGSPHGLEDRHRRVKDIKATVSFLTTLKGKVNPSRIGVLGICASDGDTSYAAQSDSRIKVLATVSAALSGKWRTDEAEKLLQEAPKMFSANLAELLEGVDPFFKEATSYCGTKRVHHERSDQKVPFESHDLMPQSNMATSSDPVAQVTEAMDKTTIGPERQLPIRSITASASEPIDGTTTVTTAPARITTTTYPARKSIRHDNIDRREVMLRGKEGSRQRRRWENDRLLSNPWVQPPLPSDWEVRPTHPIRNIPYYLAPLWDAAELQRAVESQLRGRKNSRTIRARRHHGPNGTGSPDEAAAMVPKELRARLKHNRTAKGLLQDLEEEVRAFVRQWQQREAKSREEGLHDIPLTSDSEDDDTVVFVGRGGVMHEGGRRKQKDKYNRWHDTLSNEKLVFEGADGDRGAGFARWLVHCVGSYYGLRTWSVTRQVEGAESRRQAYVGVDTRARAFIARGLDGSREVELPFPLWGMV
ncbi:hypothetical protein DV736_g4659, partial [Chaetothyriales sp. CBS 134916]